MQRARSSVIDVLFTLALFCVFCASALAVVLIGADVYTSTARNMDQNFSARTAVSYVAEKVRQSDAAGAVALGEIGGGQALVPVSYTHLDVYKRQGGDNDPFRRFYHCHYLTVQSPSSHRFYFCGHNFFKIFPCPRPKSQNFI